MKKSPITLLLILVFSSVFAQVGSDCNNPFIINSLPFNLSASSDSTGNNYSNICGSSYSSENDFILEYTPSTDIYISASTLNTAIYVGLFITEGCPDVGSCVVSNEGQLGNPSIGNTFLHGGTTYYIIISNEDAIGLGTMISTDFTLDIIEVDPFDAGVTEIIGLESGCSLSSQTVTATITNFGADSIYNFDIAYNINSGTEIIETVTDTILPGETLNHSFSTNADFSTINTYNVAVYTLLNNDADNNNDSSFININSIPTISSFPYLEDFEGANSYWFTEGSNSSWELGEPAGTIINTASSASNSWVTNLTGNHSDYESSTLNSVCFDFTSLTNPLIEFDIWTETQNIITSVNFEYTIDGGLTWVSLAIDAAGTNWDNPWNGSTSGWIHVSNSVPNLGGTSNIKFRYNFSCLSTGYEGVAIDNFEISSCDTPYPVADFTYTNTSDTHFEFESTSSDATTFLWDFEDLSTSTDENPAHDFFSIDNTYNVILIVTNECGSDTTNQFINIVISDINSINTSTIQIYPNPAHKYVNIIYNGIGTLSLYNINGTIIYSSLIDNNHKIDISKFEKGFYFVRIQTNETVLTRKIEIK